MDWTLIYGFLIVMGLFLVVWFAIVVPSERRDHERKLALIQKRLAERQNSQNEWRTDDNEATPGQQRDD